MKKTDLEIKAIIEEIIALCKFHQISIAHEDSQGAFQITNYLEDHSDWLRSANNSTV